MRIRTICNPINISYQYQAPMRSRESADPAVVLYKDEYYLFASHDSGYWVFSDLASWEFIEVDLEKQPEFSLFAPGPVVYKATGFMRGAGHGCLFADKNGRYRKMDTVAISVNRIFERRLCLFPAKVEDGLIYTNTYRGDYPRLLPHEVDDPFTDSDAGWHLLSLHKTAKASSVPDDHHTPDKAFDESLRTWWSAKTGNAGEWLWTDLGKTYEVCAVQINFADQDVEAVGGRGHGFAYKYTPEASLDGEGWFTLIDRRDSADDLSHDYIQLDGTTDIRYLKLTNHGETPAGGKFSVSGLRVFGFGDGEAPMTAPDFTATRCEDARNMTVTRDPVEDARGYIIRWGIHPDQLHTHWQVIGATRATVYCLTKGVAYFVTVDAYNESGVTRETKLQRI
ncbi:MAG: discoidin domain-containing protein [Clostridia bacterium]|nr:discoidin domain-containing protein [Clostridia bacterium]